MRICAALLLSFLAFCQTGPDPWKPAELIPPKEVAAMLPGKPVLFHVGFGTLYRNKHIPGSIYVGAGNTDKGLESLRQAAAKLPRNREIVIYCGCCPWDKCPNMRPAFRVLKEMGFTRVRAMYTPTNFARDWIEKGYPTAQ
jgi:thiosulfate/3-mercaptopyruvate sulfurtransferase